MTKYRAPIPKETRKLIKELFSNRCGDCGEGNPIKLGIHHLDVNPANNNPENLRLVCANCHAFNYHPDNAENILLWQEEKEQKILEQDSEDINSFGF